MDFINLSKKHSLASTISHTILNILLVVAVWLSIFVTKFPYLAIGLVILSKWRTLAVRPRYWAVNIKSNLVDVIFSLSIVVLLWHWRIDALFSTAILIAIYAVWLTVIKPQSSEIFVKIQALMAVFFGMMTLAAIGFSWGPEILAVASFVVGYATFRHVVSFHGEKNIEILSLFWAMIFAEIVWTFSFWLAGYNFFGMLIPQLGIILTALSFAAFEFLSKRNDESKRLKEILAPLGIMILLCLYLIIFGSGNPTGI